MKILNNDVVNELRNDFPMFKNNPLMQGHRFVYLDNSATTFKPSCVIDTEKEYYEKYSANTHRGDYDLAHSVDTIYLNARKQVAKFINANDNEIIFTSGDTLGMNIIALGLIDYLKPNDEIILSYAEHASNILPWFTLAKFTNATIKYVPLDENGNVTIENLKKTITNKTKIISFAQISNVLGNIVDIKSCASLAHSIGALFMCDAAQSISHMPIDVKDLDVDFLTFSGHKMCGPTGIGVLYGKYNLLKKLNTILTGGGMNARFNENEIESYELPPLKFEAGTPNIAGALGLAKACEYLNNIDLTNISSWERHLKNIVLDKIKNNKNIIVYNPNSNTGILDFNMKDTFAQDGATLLNSKGICVRAGQHCAKILHNYLNTYSTIRASFFLYNNEEDANQLADALNEGGHFLDAYFN